MTMPVASVAKCKTPAAEHKTAEAKHKTIDIVQERGQREVFCGLTGIVWLHRRMQDAFFLVVGSRTCAHLLQSAAGVMIFAEPRFGTAILDDRDLSGSADFNDELERIVNDLVVRRPEIKTLFLVGSCPSEVIKLDLEKAAERLNKIHPLRVLSFSGSGIETTFTQGEDNCLKALIADMVQGSPAGDDDVAFSRPCELLVLGTVADVVEDQFTRLLQAMGINSVAFLPTRSASRLPLIDQNTKVVLVQPFVGESLRELTRHGLQHIQTVFPFGAEGTLRWLKAIADAFDIDSQHFDRVVEAPLSRARTAMKKVAEPLQGRRVSFFPDSQLEIPMARFLYEECGMQPVEIGVPFFDRQCIGAELDLLPDNIRFVEGQHVDEQLARLHQDQPDLTVCGMGLGNPLEAQGLATKWSIELVFSPIHGFEQAADLAALFVKPLKRRQLLKVPA